MKLNKRNNSTNNNVEFITGTFAFGQSRPKML